MTLPKGGRTKPNKQSHDEVKCPYCGKKFLVDDSNSEFITKTEKSIWCDFCGEEFSSSMCK